MTSLLFMKITVECLLKVKQTQIKKQRYTEMIFLLSSVKKLELFIKCLTLLKLR